MPQPADSSLNSSVEYGGHRYDVQSQYSTRDAPVVESLVFRGGQTLVRLTASYDDIASRFGFSGDDGRHLLELQHADLIRKIRHGMLADDATSTPPSGDESPRVVDDAGVAVDPAEIDDPSVLALLRELNVTTDEARPVSEPAVSAASRRPWWRRLAIVIRLPIRTTRRP